jgi:hypothetical protein
MFGDVRVLDERPEEDDRGAGFKKNGPPKKPSCPTQNAMISDQAENP